MELYYHEGLNMKEVGAILGVTESRICQLHSQAASRLRVALLSRLHVTPVLAATARRR
jgi:RNA polymerase sigma factor for flagellar operon FliA